MQIQLPPVLFYGIGALLVVFGALRSVHLGWQKRQLNIDEGEAPRGREQKRHIVMGVVWVAMGLFLIISTFLNTPP